jgi:hypothetical protein
MPLKAAMWLHGTLVEAEYPGNLQSWVRKGWGTHFVGQPGTDNWFHIPLPTPVILDDVRPQLTRLFVLYDSDLGLPAGDRPALMDLHVYDGPRKVKEFSLPALAGKHDAALDAANSFDVTPALTILLGLGLAVHVRFPPTYPPGVLVHYEILFTSAGADFMT